MRKITNSDLTGLYESLKTVGISTDPRGNNLYMYLMDEILPVYMNNKYHLLDANHLIKKIKLACDIYRTIPPYKYGLNLKCLIVLIMFEDIAFILEPDIQKNHFKRSSQLVKEKYDTNIKYILESYEIEWLYNCIEYPKNNRVYPLKKIYSTYYEHLYCNFANDIRRISLLPYDYGISNIYHDLCIKNTIRSVKYNIFQTWVILHNAFKLPLAMNEILNYGTVKNNIDELNLLLKETKETKDLSNYI